MSDWTTVAITAAATLTSALLAGGLSLLVVRKQERARGRADLAAALQAHGYAADKLGLEIGQLPPPALGARRTQAAIARIPLLDWWIGQLARHTLARPALRSLDGYMAASNRLVLVAPRELLEPVQQLNELLTRVETRQTQWHPGWDIEWQADWNAARRAVVNAARTAIGTD